MKILLIFFAMCQLNSNAFSMTGPIRPASEDPLVRASETKDVQKVNNLLKEGATPNIIDKRSGFTPLMAASFAGSIEIVKLLLKAGADVDQLDLNGENALIVAMGSNSEDIPLLLIFWGADINHKSSGGTTAFLTAAGHNSQRVLAVLKEKGVNINERGWANRTALHNAALAESPVNIPTLLDWGLEINAQDDDGLTPLMYAVQFNETRPGVITNGKLPPLKTVDLLLEKGADCFVKNKDGKTAIDLAKAATVTATIKLLELRCEVRQ